MKEYIDNGIKVIEYSCDDWEDGKISGDWRPGKTLVENKGSGLRHFSFLPEDQFQLIEQRRKEIYIKKTEELFDLYKSNFNKNYSKSEHKERLIKTEIDNYENLLFAERLPLYQLNNIDRPIKDLPFDSITINSIRTLYQKLIVRGEKEYHFTESPNVTISVTNDSLHIKVEVISKYLTWLKTFSTSTQSPRIIGKKFYTSEDFHNLVTELLTVESFRVKDFLDYHQGLSIESLSHFSMALRKFLLIDMGYKEPTQYSENGYGVEDDSTPDQINLAFLWEMNNTKREATRINTNANPELYKEVLSEADYINICDKLIQVETSLTSTENKSENLKAFEIEYKALLQKRKEEYESSLKNNRSTTSKRDLSIRQICLIHFYEDRPIEKKDRNDLSINYGYSGDKLYNTYILIFNDDSQRQKGTRQNVKDLTKVLSRLTGKALLRAKADLKEAEENISKK